MVWNVCMLHVNAEMSLLELTGALSPESNHDLLRSLFSMICLIITLSPNPPERPLVTPLKSEQENKITAAHC